MRSAAAGACGRRRPASAARAAASRSCASPKPRISVLRRTWRSRPRRAFDNVTSGAPPCSSRHAYGVSCRARAEKIALRRRSDGDSPPGHPFNGPMGPPLPGRWAAGDSALCHLRSGSLHRLADGCTVGAMTHAFHADDVDVDADRASELIAADAVQLVDVRERYEWEAGRIAGARHIELE